LVFQAGTYHDRDHDRIGDFGFLAEMSAGPIPGRADLRLALLPPPWYALAPVIDGYRYVVFIPDGAGGAISADHDHGIDHVLPSTYRPESSFVIFAWPDNPANGSRMVAITTGSVVYWAPFTAGDPPPSCYALFGHHGWANAAAPPWRIY
jgi:hypothetical protein